MHAVRFKPDAQAYQQNITESIKSYGIPMHSMGSEPDAQAYPQNVMEVIESLPTEYHGVHWILPVLRHAKDAICKMQNACILHSCASMQNGWMHASCIALDGSLAKCKMLWGTTKHIAGKRPAKCKMQNAKCKLGLAGGAV